MATTNEPDLKLYMGCAGLIATSLAIALYLAPTVGNGFRYESKPSVVQQQTSREANFPTLAMQDRIMAAEGEIAMTLAE